MKLNGIKTYLAGGASILTGLSVIVANISPFDSNAIIGGALTVIGGLAVIGLGHKLDKIKAIFEKLAGN